MSQSGILCDLEEKEERGIRNWQISGSIIKMKIARHQIFEKKEKYFIILLVLAVAAVIVTFVGGISRWTVEGNVVRRVNDESQFLAKQQAELINKVIEEQFDKVSTISGMMEKGLSFYDEKDRKILQAFVEKNNIRTLGYIDKKGMP